MNILKSLAAALMGFALAGCAVPQAGTQVSALPTVASPTGFKPNAPLACIIQFQLEGGALTYAQRGALVTVFDEGGNLVRIAVKTRDYSAWRNPGLAASRGIDSSWTERLHYAIPPNPQADGRILFRGKSGAPIYFTPGSQEFRWVTPEGFTIVGEGPCLPNLQAAAAAANTAFAQR